VAGVVRFRIGKHFEHYMVFGSMSVHFRVYVSTCRTDHTLIRCRKRAIAEHLERFRGAQLPELGPFFRQVHHLCVCFRIEIRESDFAYRFAPTTREIALDVARALAGFRFRFLTILVPAGTYSPDFRK